MAHPVRFDPQGNVQRVGWNVLEKIRPVFAGRAVQIRCANPLHRLEKGPLIRASLEMLAASEHEVLKQMRETGFAEFFVF